MNQESQHTIIGPGQNRVQNTCRSHRCNRGCRIGCRKKFDHFSTDALTGKPCQTLDMRRNRGQSFGVQPSFGVTVQRVKPEKAQNTQIVLADTLIRVVYKPHMPVFKIRQPIQRVDNHPIPPCIKRIHGEITPPGVLSDIAGISDDSVTAKGFHILTKRRYLVRNVTRDHGDGPMFDTRRHGFQASGLRHFYDVLRMGIGSDINIMHRHTQ